MTTVENKIPDTSNLATKTALTTVENKITNISNLATKTALTTVEGLKIKYLILVTLLRKVIITQKLLRLKIM